MTDNEDRLIIAPAGAPQRWILHRPVDPYGDGYVHRLLVEISDDQLTATSTATLEGKTQQNLPDFLAGLVRDWRGWQGVRSWTSMEGEMTLEARHDGRGYVSVAVILRQEDWSYASDAWLARIVLTIEAGEQLRRIANAAEHILRL